MRHYERELNKPRHGRNEKWQTQKEEKDSEKEIEKVKIPNQVVSGAAIGIPKPAINQKTNKRV